MEGCLCVCLCVVVIYFFCFVFFVFLGVFFWPNISMIKPNKTADSAYIVAEDLGTAKNKYDIFFHRVSSKHRKAD